MLMFDETLKVIAGLYQIEPIEILPERLNELFEQLSAESIGKDAYIVEDESGRFGPATPRRTQSPG
ncbi:MAG: hypothetical protein HC834_03350 [Rhodospirillales bacterium]|nr:hypothetical protein [Rhodospirillales bacterium]